MKRPLLLMAIVLVILGACAPVAQGPAPVAQEPTATPPPTPTPNPNLLPVRGLLVQFDRGGARDGYWSGQVLQLFDTYDSPVGRLVREEVSAQLDEMVKLGVNTIRFELRSSTPEAAGNAFVAPICALPPVLGLQYPQPTDLELKNLVEFFDVVQSKGIKIELELINTHMDEQPPTRNSTWLGAILNAVKDHPALDWVGFDGAPHRLSSGMCGGPAEAPLWDGPGSIPAAYIQWAMQYGHSLGLPWRAMSAEAIVGDYYSFMQGPGGSEMTDRHHWDPVYTLKTIFDNLNIPDDQRTYALSWYEHPKCMTARELDCTEIGPHAWAIETAQHVRDVVGNGNGARIIAPEMGLYASEPDWNWTTEQALESLVWVMKQYGIDGGSFWRWVDFTNAEEHDPRLATPIKKRGVGFAYNPIAGVMKQLYTMGYAEDAAFDPAAAATASVATAASMASTAQARLSAPPDDTFAAAALDDFKWVPDVTAGASLTNDGALTLSTDGSQASAGASVASRWLFTGDFDMQVDWRLGDDWKPPAQDHVDAAFLAVGMGPPNRYWITRLGLPGDAGQFMAFGEATGQIGQPVATTARAGKFRITRSGATLTFFYDVGDGWQQLESLSVPTGPAQLRMGMASVNASLAFTTHFSNFRVSSGAVQYGQ